jgi:hypothetical protein
VTPLDCTCILHVTQARASPLLPRTTQGYHSFIALCSLRLRPFAAKEQEISTTSAAVFTTTRQRQRPETPSPSTSYIAHYMICRAGTLCHWACYEFGSAHIWVWAPFYPVHASMCPLNRALLGEHMILLGWYNDLHCAYESLSKASLPAGIITFAMQNVPIEVWARQRVRQHRTVASRSSMPPIPKPCPQNCISAPRPPILCGSISASIFFLS